MGKGKGKEEKIPVGTWIAMGLMVLLLLGGVYYYMIDRPVRLGIAAADAERESLEARAAIMEQQAANVSSVAGEMDQLRVEGNLSYMPSYNSEGAELAMLNQILNAAADDYTLSFSTVERSENQIRRPFILELDTYSYAAAKWIIYNLLHGEYRCLISSVNLSGTVRRDEENSPVHLSLSGTFYETMAGGEPDVYLPENDRGGAVDPANAGIAGLGGMSGLGAGIGIGMAAMQDIYSRGSDYSGLDQVMEQPGAE